MQLTIINASPKKKNSNTDIVLQPFIEGFMSNKKHSVKSVYCADIDNDIDGKSIFLNSDVILLAFPLYTYGLTPLAARWVNRIKEFKGETNNTKMAFFCQYGFPEACHARALERQLNIMCKQLSIENLGMLIRGGCGGIKHMPDVQNQKLFSKFYDIGISFGKLENFDQEQLDLFSAPEKANSGGFLSKLKSELWTLFVNKTFWKVQLKKNNAVAKHWAQPLLK